MKILILLLINSIVIFANIGKITSVKGEVYVDRNNNIESARSGYILEIKDKIITKDSSKAMLLFNDNTSITVGKNSNLEVSKYVFDKKVVKNNKATFKFGKGVFRTITGKLGKLNPGGFNIKTRTATIGIRGSYGITRVGPNWEIQHTTYSGGFVLRDNITGQSVWIPKGMTAKFINNKLIVLPTTKQELLDNDKFIGKGKDRLPLVQRVEDIPVRTITKLSTIVNENTEVVEKVKQIVVDEVVSKTIPIKIPEKIVEKIPDEIPTPYIPPYIPPSVPATPAFDVEALTQVDIDGYIDESIDNIFSLSDDYLTPVDTISNSNTAIYKGHIKGVYDYTDPNTNVQETYNATGIIKFNIDFANATVIGDFSFDGARSVTNLNSPIDGDIVITDNTFHIVDPNLYGTGIDGKFYGSNAGVIGGKIDTVGEDDSEFIGVFGAIDDPFETIGTAIDIAALTQDDLNAYITRDNGFTLSNDYLTTDNIISNYTASDNATYKGVVNGYNLNSDGVFADSGTVDLSMDFGNNNFNGTISGLTVGKVTINGGSIVNNTFNTTDSNIVIDSYNTIDNSILSGKFYGSEANIVGGHIELTEYTNTNKFKGTFGAIKQ